MTKVKPKLYLNMSPETVEEGGLVFARNMKIDDDGHLTSDYGYKNISTVVGSTDLLAGRTIVGHIVGLDNKIYLFTQKYLSPGFEYRIFEYDEVRRDIVDTGVRKWTWGGGTIYGCISTNVSGEKILTIGEEKHANASTPLKHINLSNGYYNVADESFYTQAPACPTANLILKNTYVKTIPNGVYVFFIRYRIRKDVYTNWFICSRPIFGGTSEKINTIQGGVQYINLHKDAAKSFVFQLTFPVSTNKDNYDKFQLGFIITHDDAVDARVWKSFSTSGFFTAPTTSQNLIYFDYEDVKEANIDDLLANTYELYNVKNITNFKNKLYISNYKESDFNPDLSSLASGIKLYLEHSGESANSTRNMTYNGTSLNYNYKKGYFDSYGNGSSIKNLFPYSGYVSDFIFDISDLSKVSTKEKENVVTFNLSWDSRANPDVAIVNNVKNNLWHKVIFGQDYDRGAPTDYTDAAQLQRVGLQMLENSGGTWAVYAPLNVDRYYGNHPFYNEGFTFAFGSLGVGNTTNRKVTKFNAYDYLYRKIGTDTNKGWFSIDGGFSKEAMAVAEETLRSEIESRSFFAKCYFRITSGAKVYTIGHSSVMELDNFAGSLMNFNYIQESGGSYVINSDYLTDSYKYYNDGDGGLEILNPAYASSSMDDDFKIDIRNWVYYNIIRSEYFEGIDENGSIILKIDNDLITATSIEVCFKKFDFSVDIESVAEEEIENDKVIVKKIKVSLKTTDYVSLCSVGIKNNLISTSYSSGTIEQKSTLMPYSVYQAYVHFVDSHNIVTNGIPLQRIPSSGTTGPASSDGDVISLRYTNSNGTNDTYKSFFISLVNIGDIVMEGFGWQKSPTDNTFNILHCLELDAMLYNINENITIKIVGSSETTITNAKYYSSGESTPSIAFGNCGFIGWYGSSSDDYKSSKFYIIISRNKNTEELNSLTKASGYIPINSDSGALPDGYYGSWLCLVKKPSFALSSSCYVVGKDVYATKRTATFKLVDFDNYIQIQNSPTYCVRSNYNLNYLSLTEDISDSIFSVGKASSGVKQIAKVINSAILSYIYELRGMYKDFSNKYFRQIDTDNRTEFDNTIRVSNVLSDETFNNAVFKFTAEDYYNVPTDRGIIVSLFSIGSNIYVHTKGSLYKFDANQTIMASDTDIKLQESEPFSAGITQIIDSQYGYGGIDNKEAGCVTFDSYFFYDKYSTHIFAYGGNNQVQLIDASIYKLLKYYSPEACITLHDDINHRVLFMFGEGTHMEVFFTISYNYKSKTFVSIHDLDLANSFAGRTRCFSYSGKRISTTGHFCELFNKDIDLSTTEVIIENLNIRNIYGDATEFSNILIHSIQTSMFNIGVVMFPSNALREVINFVKYIGETVEEYITEEQDYDLILIPKHNNVNPVKSLQIVTDTCLSNIVDTTVDDTVRPDHTLTDHKGFKHEIDSWNTNYFRNILNIDNVYNYPGETDEGGPGQPRVNYRKSDSSIATAHPNSDNHSLVYGKYYVLLFNFKDDVPIKFEEVFINSEKY